MDLKSLQEILNVYSWAVASLIMVIMAAIARFYQRKFGINTYYHLYFIPLIIFLIALLQIFPVFSVNEELIEFIGSLISFLTCYSLYTKMVGVR